MPDREQTFSASVWRVEGHYVAQCLEVDVASQGTTEEEALENLREALELHFEPRRATATPFKPLPYREVKRKLEAAGFTQVGQKGVTSSLPGSLAKVPERRSRPVTTK